MKNKILIGLISFMVAFNGYLFLESKRDNEAISSLKTEVKTKSAEIANLEMTIDTIRDELNSKESIIISQEKEMNKMIVQIQSLENELSHYESLRQLDIVATAYTSDCDGCTGITATGYDVRNTEYKDGYRVVAVDTNVIPMYSLLYIDTKTDEDFIGIAMDKGGAIKGNKMDVLVASTQRAIKFGVQNSTVTILREGAGK